MAEDIEVKLNLTADDQASPAIRKLVNDLKRMKEQLSKMARSKVGDPVNANLRMWSEEKKGEIRRRMAWARDIRDAGKLNSAYSELKKRAEKYNETFVDRKKLTAKEHKDFRRTIGMLDALRSLRNREVKDRERLEHRYSQRVIDGESAIARARRRSFNEWMDQNRTRMRIRTATEARERREERARLRERARRINDVRQAGSRMVGTGRNAVNRADGSFFNSPVFYGMMGVGAGAAAVRSSFGAAKDSSTAQANLRIFGELSPSEIRNTRQGWLNRSSIAHGMKPGEGMNIATEVLKTGIPKQHLQAVTEGVMKAAAGLDLDYADTMKITGRMATLTQDMKNFDPKFIMQVLNAVGLSARETAADSAEIISSIRRGGGIIASTKMSVEELSAFAAGGVSSGIQQGRTGTLMGFIAGEMVNAGRARGQRAKDIQQALRNLGLGNRRGAARRFAENPAEMLMDMLDKMGGMDEVKRGETARLLGMREWDTEILQMVQVRDDIRRTLEVVRDPKNARWLEWSSAIKLESLEGTWKRTMGAWTLFWSEVGFGFEEIFRDITEFFIDLGKNIDLNYVKAHVQALVNGFLLAFDVADGKQLMEKVFGKGGGQVDYIDAFRRFSQGFFTGVKDVFEVVWGIVKTLGELAGFDTSTAEGVGELIAQILGFSLAIHFARPAFALAGFVKDSLLIIAGGIWVLSKALTALGVGGFTGLGASILGRFGVGAAGVLGGLAAGALGLTVTLTGVALIGAALAVAVMNWDEIKGFFANTWDGIKEALTPRTRDEYRERMDKNRQRLQDQSKKNLQDWKSIYDWFTGGSSSDSDADLPAAGANDSSFERPVRQMSQDFKRLASQIQLASLGSSGSALSFGGGGGGSGGVYGGGVTSGSVSPFRAPDGGSGTGPVNSFGLGRGGSAGTPSATFASKAPAIMARLQKDFGLTREQAAGIVGNLGHESMGFSKMQEISPLGGGKGGYGWAQWTGPRRRAFFAWAKSKGLDPNSDEANYGFLKHELQTTEKGALAAVRRQSTAQGAMQAFERTYERSGVKNWSSRSRYTQQALGLGAGGGSGGSGAIPGVGREGLRVKGGANGQAFAGGHTAAGTLALAQMLQANGVAGGLNRFTSFNDRYHAGTRSKHAFGLAGDFTIKDPSMSAQAAADVRRQFRAAGLTDDMFKVLDEYKNPSARSTGGHIHYQFQNAAAAQMYAQYAERQRMLAQAAKQQTGSSWAAGASAFKADPAQMARAAQPNASRGGFGLNGPVGTGGSPVSININGNNSDPEALANLVQRRITETMNWRTHDVEHDI